MKMTGSIPSVIGSMRQLQVLNLQNNLFSGTIPTELGKLTELRQLNLQFNELTGTVPCELLALPKLSNLTLNNNSLIPGGDSACWYDKNKFNLEISLPNRFKNCATKGLKSWYHWTMKHRLWFILILLLHNPIQGRKYGSYTCLSHPPSAPAL